MVDNILLILFIFSICIAILFGKYIFSSKPEIPHEAKQYYNTFLKKENNILIITAHPDDECMFFAPTIKGLSRSAEIVIHLLCFTNGYS